MNRKINWREANREQNQTPESKSELANRPSATPNARCPQGVGSSRGAQPLGLLPSHTPTEEPSSNLLTQTGEPGTAPAHGARRKRSPRAAGVGPTGDGGRRSKVAELGVCSAWGEGITGQVRLGCRVSREVPVLAVPSSPEPAELREARAAREESGRAREPLTEADGARRPFVCGRGAGALRPVAPALARPSSRGLPDSPARAPARPPPVLPPPRLRPQPRPCPGPRAPTCCGGDSWSPGDRTGDHPAGTQTRRRPLLSSRASAPPAWTLGPGAAWPSRRAPALQSSCRSSSGSSLLQGLEVPAKPVSEEEMAGCGALPEPRLELNLFFGSASSSTKTAEN